MKVLKILGGLLLFLLLAYLVLCFVSKSQLKLEESKVIKCDASEIFSQINDFEQWKKWSPWHLMDTSMKVTFSSSNTAGLGAKYSWDSENMGTGNQEITESIENKSLITTMQFGKDPSYNKGIFTLEPADNGTKVTWAFEGSEVGFFAKPMNMMMKGYLQDSYKQGLENLAKKCE